MANDTAETSKVKPCPAFEISKDMQDAIDGKTVEFVSDSIVPI